MEKDRTEGLQAPAIQCPDNEELHSISDRLKLKCTKAEIEGIQEFLPEVCASYQKVYRMADKQLPVKYPRVPGSKARKEEEGWYWRCNIKGAKSGLLSGKTFAIKDNVCVAGVPMMCGSKVLEGYTPEIDATIVTRILDAGGTILGKAVCEDMCICINSCTCSTGPIRNPYDPSRTTGGSSSGSALLVANGSVDMSIGCDQGGSIRIPAACCGIVGLKPSFGLVPYTGIISGELTLDHVGPMAKTVKDCATLLQVIAGYDNGNDPRQSPFQTVPEYSKLLERDMKGIKIGVLKEGFECVEQELAEFVGNMVEKISETGATVLDISVPEHKDGTDYGWKGYYPLSLSRAMAGGIALRPYDLPWTAKYRVLWDEYISRHYGNKFYAKTQNLSQMLKEKYDQAFENVDVLVMPTMLEKPQLLPTKQHTMHEVHNLTHSRNSNMAPFNLSGHPALSINVGFLDGLPCGLMIVGRMFDDLTVLQIAQAYERIG